MNIDNVKTRERNLNNKPVSDNHKLGIMVEASSYSKGTDEISSVIQNWRGLNRDEIFAFVECMDIVKKYMNNNLYPNIKTVSESVKNMMLPYIKDIKKTRTLLSETFEKYPDLKEDLLNETSFLSACDRVTNNQKQLSKIGIDKLFKEQVITTESDKEACIENVCDLINDLKIPISVKYNIALENALYCFDKYGIKYPMKSILEQVTDYFMSNNIEDNSIERLQNVLSETPLYDNTDKSNVIYVFEMTRSKMDDSEFGIPEEKKYPMPDKKHVLSAIKLFNYVSPGYEKELAKNIKKKIKEFGIKDIHVGDKNHFSKYYAEATIDKKHKCPYCSYKDYKQKVVDHIKKNHKDKVKDSTDVESLLEAKTKTTCPYCHKDIDAKDIKKHIKEEHDEESKKHSKFTEAYIESVLNEHGHSANTDDDDDDDDGYIDPDNTSNNKPDLDDNDSTSSDNNSQDGQGDVKTSKDCHDPGKTNDKDSNESNKADQDNNDESSDSDEDDDKVDNAVQEISRIRTKSNKIPSILNSFKTLKVKSAEGLTKTIEKIFTQSPESIVLDLPDILGFVRRIVCLSALGISGPAGLITTALGLVTNKMIELNLRRPQMEKTIKDYKKELEKVDRQIDKISNEKKKEKLKQYRKKLDDDIFKLESANEKLYSQKELDKKEEESYGESVSDQTISLSYFLKKIHPTMITELYKAINLFQFVVNDDSSWSKLENSGALVLADPESLHKFQLADKDTIEGYITYKKVGIPIAKFLPLVYAKKTMLTPEISIKIRNMLFSIADKVQDIIADDFVCYIDGTDDLYNFIFEYSGTINTEILSESKTISYQVNALEGIDEEMQKLFDGNKINTLENVFQEAVNPDNVDSIVTVLKETSDLLDIDRVKTTLESLSEAVYGNNYKSAVYKSKLKDCINNISMNESHNEYRNTFLTYDRLKNINEAYDTILELSIGSKAKLATDKLKNSALRMNDKQKNVSKNLDDSLENLDDKLRKELSDNAREKIIKGRILPKASKIIKLGIGTGALYAVQPALAAIAILGGIGASKIGKKREKQFILDEIDIQLKLVERKIPLAENNNDMKSLEELFKIEKKLKREKQRIMYNMKAYYPVSAN